MHQVMAVGVAASLALSVGGGRVGVSVLTRWRGDRVEILHHTLQVPHLVVQLLRAVAAVAVLEIMTLYKLIPISRDCLF